MTTKVIAAFPGTGKSYFASISEQKNVADLDSGDYTLDYAAMVRFAILIFRIITYAP